MILDRIMHSNRNRQRHINVGRTNNSMRTNNTNITGTFKSKRTSVSNVASASKSLVIILLMCTCVFVGIVRCGFIFKYISVID